MTSENRSRREFICGAIGAIALAQPGAKAYAAAATLVVKNAASTDKKIFAHYMVCFHGTLDHCKSEIAEAQKRGIDGFALNCGAWQGSYRNGCLTMYEAAKELGTGFQLFVSMDYCCGNTTKATGDAIETFREHENQFRYHGRPVLSSFGGEGSRTIYDYVKGPEFADPNSVYFVPAFYPKTYREHPNPIDVEQVFNDWPNLDGYFYFGATGNGIENSTANHLLAQKWMGAGKTFMGSVTPYYRSFGRLSETSGFTSMAREWEGLIADNVPWIEIVTWNDYNEKTYVAPFGGPLDTIICGNNNDYAHQAYLDASRYYIDWFKSGVKPKITRDDLYYFYRTEPKAAFGLQISDGERKRGVTKIWGADSLIDNIFTTCFLNAPATLTIRSGAASQDFQLSAGVNHVDMPFEMGFPQFTLKRNSSTILDKTGEFEISDKGGASNYNYFAGSARDE